MVLYGGKFVHMPNGETMMATHTAPLPCTQLPLDAWKCDVLQQPLLPLGQFYNEGFKVTLNSETVHLTKDGISKLSGMIDYINSLYLIPL